MRNAILAHVTAWQGSRLFAYIVLEIFRAGYTTELASSRCLVLWCAIKISLIIRNSSHYPGFVKFSGKNGVRSACLKVS